MKIGVIQASSRMEKNALLYETTKTYADNHEVINFGCYNNGDEFSFIEVSIEIGLLLSSGSIDFVVTGCSSGQGMMLACNNMPGVICGYAPSPMDAYLFAQINNGNVISLPLGEGYTYSGKDNCIQTIKRLFSEPFGQGYPREAAIRERKDTALLKDIRAKSQIDFILLLEKLDQDLIKKVLKKDDVVNYILANGSSTRIKDWIAKHR